MKIHAFDCDFDSFNKEYEEQITFLNQKVKNEGFNDSYVKVLNVIHDSPRHYIHYKIDSYDCEC